jgi:hypothetical protein
MNTDTPRRWQYLTFDEQQRIRKGLPLNPVKKKTLKKVLEKKKKVDEIIFNAQEWMKRLEKLKTK